MCSSAEFSYTVNLFQNFQRSFKLLKKQDFSNVSKFQITPTSISKLKLKTFFFYSHHTF
jgi:hypothetical protein